MTARQKHKVASRPAPREIEVEITEGDFAGWWCRARADFPTSVVTAIESREVGAFLNACRLIIIEHNMPDSAGEIASDVADVDPYSGLAAMLEQVLSDIGRLPPR